MHRPLDLILVLGLIVAAGCSPADPAKFPLRAGQRVVVPGSDLPSGELSAILIGTDGEPFPTDSDPWKYGILYTGDEAVVIRDPGNDSSKDAADEYRYVTIRVTKHTPKFDRPSLLGLECQAKRNRLRPTP